MLRISLVLLLLQVLSINPRAQQSWGTLANTDFDGESVKSVFFFSGNWRNGIQFYDYNPDNNTGLYTSHPSDARHLGWSESAANRRFVLDEMILRGFNVINMSYWGLPGTDNWAFWAPMQSSTASHDELFNAALGKDILIAPYIESFAATDDYPEFIFRSDFPGTAANPAPQLTGLILDLVERYLLHPLNPEWPEKWARMYDQHGGERYLISVIHVASDQGGVTHPSFAAGFDKVAGAVYDSTGIHIGFAIDALPPDATYAPGVFKPVPATTGPLLAGQSSLLAIQCFIPEIWLGESDEDSLLTWKEDFTSKWMATGIPVILDVSPGYDANILFPESPVYGNNASWRQGQSQLVGRTNPAGLTFNAWNGYTEGLVAVPTLEYGSATYSWICDLFGDGTCTIPPEGIAIQQRGEKDLICRWQTADRQLILEFAAVSDVVDISVFDISGRQAWKDSQPAVPGKNNLMAIQFPGGTITPGIWLIQLRTGPRIYSGQVLITP